MKSLADRDEAGVPQSLKATHEERFSISADGTELSYTLVITDPVIFTAPLTLQTTRRWQPGTKVEKYDCTAKWDVAEGYNGKMGIVQNR